ncbi:hypothetical protein M9458_037088, partial [Cirrhinus mrigala]
QPVIQNTARHRAQHTITPLRGAKARVPPPVFTITTAPNICAVGLQWVCQSPLAPWLEDP